MNSALTIASEEWRYWLRSKLALCVFTLFVVVLLTSSLLTAVRMYSEEAERAHHQTEADQAFLSQPARHPHRMVHYGHYVFRTPTPLASFDPGLEAVTGQSMFLEGHRQNTAMFSSSAASADIGGVYWLSPALIYQLFGPLLILLLGHSSVAREREAKTLGPLLAQGLSGYQLLIGKALALIAFTALILIPLLLNALVAVSVGESLMTGLLLTGVYFLYLLVWCAVTLFFSGLLSKRTNVLVVLVALWLLLTLVVPSLAVNTASRHIPLAGKIESDLRMLSEVKDLSDGHDVSGSERDQLLETLFEEQGVKRVEDLSLNIRGLVAQKAEKQLTESMNAYAEKRMSGEAHQTRVLTQHGWLSPLLAVAASSRTISATDLRHYQQFLRQAETVRYAFVQALNTAHAEKLDYTADINRSRDEASNRLTRIDASHWEMLERFEFTPDSPTTRLKHARASINMLLAWIVVFTVLLTGLSKRLKP